MQLTDYTRLEAEGRWADICALVSLLPGDLTGDDLARAYLATSKALELTATTPEQYREALAHSRLAVASAQPSGLLHTWALHRVASLAADIGHYHLAGEAGTAFLQALPQHQQAQAVAPWVYAAMARVQSRSGNHLDAIRFARQALEAGVGGEFQERVQLIYARVLARAGRITDAFGALPASLSYTDAGKLHAAMALIYARAHQWLEAEVQGRLAFRYFREGRLYDFVEAAELLLTLKAAATALGRHRQAVVWSIHTAALLSRWSAEVLIRLLFNLRVEGGAFLDQAASHCGPAGCKRVGLLGAVG